MGEPVRIAKLICVSDKNNNKYYDMVENADGSITATWGRVDVTSTVTHYPVGKKKWDTLLKSKLRKGYKDVTDLRAVDTPTTEFVDLTDPAVKKIVDTLQGYANTSVRQNYRVAAEGVTQQQLDRAQELIDSLVPLVARGKQTKAPNDALLDLYTVIPRKMKKVQNNLFTGDRFTKDTIADAEKKLAEEQATLDVLAGQVAVHTQKAANTGKTLLDAMGLEISIPGDKDVRLIKKLLGQNSRQYRKAFAVRNLKTQARFDKWLRAVKDKKTQLFWHGSRNENWWSILDTGLMIRPSNAVLTGAMFGQGVYAANKARKSIGYTSLSGSYWARGSAKKAFLALLDFHVGNQLHVNRHASWMYRLNWDALRTKGPYDSLYAHGGADLYNDEFVVYKPDQITIRFLVEIGG